MIIDVISLWIGRIFIWSLMLGISFSILYGLFRQREMTKIYFRALCYDLLSNKFPKEKHKVDIRVGRRWYVDYKDKYIEWEIKSIEPKTRKISIWTKIFGWL